MKVEGRRIRVEKYVRKHELNYQLSIEYQPRHRSRDDEERRNEMNKNSSSGNRRTRR